MIVTDNATGVVVGQGQFSPDVTSTALEGDLGDIEDKIDQASIDLNKVQNVYPEPPEPIRPIVSVSG